ncbi:MAG: DEAD/DEAH box helicase [Telmatospirillum sp.]|nr:DEAD/DEAH box helicase [Telmatospirillum sp.]
MTKFEEFGLAAPILRALTAVGYTNPTPIQAKAIPSILAGRDLLGIAQTGTGKTAAFALPILHLLAGQARKAPRGGCRVLVLSPTRELASQIADSFRTYAQGLNLKVALVFGGVSAGPQLKALAGGIDILVATPGRLIDHIGSGAARLGSTEFLVLDEVDQMLDLGFIKPLRRIVGQLPKQRQNLFFSATMPTEIGALADELLTDPVSVSVAPAATTVERIHQQVLLVDAANKRDLLVGLFADRAMARTIVFTRTKRGADAVARHLAAAGISAAAIHGNKSQNQREMSLASFRAGRVRALVATDIAARGIDVAGVTHVVNFELPEVAENYVHRIGRTARAGADGIAISLCGGAERDLLRNIEKVTRRKIETIDRRQPGRPAAARANPAKEAPPALRSSRQGGKPPATPDRGRAAEPAGTTGGNEMFRLAFMAPRHPAMAGQPDRPDGVPARRKARAV